MTPRLRKNFSNFPDEQGGDGRFAGAAKDNLLRKNPYDLDSSERDSACVSIIIGVAWNQAFEVHNIFTYLVVFSFFE